MANERVWEPGRLWGLSRRGRRLYATGMITLTCDKCDRTLDVDDSKALTKLVCPHCGDVNIVPGTAAKPAPRGGVTPPTRRPTGRAAAMGLPPETGQEQRVAKIHPAMFRAKPAHFLGVFLLFLGGGIGAAVFALRQPTVPWLAWACGLLAVAGLMILLAWKVMTLGETLEITTKRVTLMRGLLGKELSEIPHEDIQNIQIKQSFWDRMWGIGQLGVSSAGQDDVEIVISNIPHPYKVREMIDAYRGVMD